MMQAVLERVGRLFSRKFLTALSVEGAAVSTFWLEPTGDVWADVAIRAIALAAMVVAAWAYQNSEAAIDAIRENTTGRE